MLKYRVKKGDEYYSPIKYEKLNEKNVINCLPEGYSPSMFSANKFEEALSMLNDYFSFNSRHEHLPYDDFEIVMFNKELGLRNNYMYDAISHYFISRKKGGKVSAYILIPEPEYAEEEYYGNYRQIFNYPVYGIPDTTLYFTLPSLIALYIGAIEDAIMHLKHTDFNSVYEFVRLNGNDKELKTFRALLVNIIETRRLLNIAMQTNEFQYNFMKFFYTTMLPQRQDTIRSNTLHALIVALYFKYICGIEPKIYTPALKSIYNAITKKITLQHISSSLKEPEDTIKTSIEIYNIVRTIYRSVLNKYNKNSRKSTYPSKFADIDETINRMKYKNVPYELYELPALILNDNYRDEFTLKDDIKNGIMATYMHLVRKTQNLISSATNIQPSDYRHFKILSDFKNDIILEYDPNEDYVNDFFYPITANSLSSKLADMSIQTDAELINSSLNSLYSDINNLSKPPEVPNAPHQSNFNQIEIETIDDLKNKGIISQKTDTRIEIPLDVKRGADTLYAQIKSVIQFIEEHYKYQKTSIRGVRLNRRLYRIITSKYNHVQPEIFYQRQSRTKPNLAITIILDMSNSMNMATELLTNMGITLLLAFSKIRKLPISIYAFNGIPYSNNTKGVCYIKQIKSYRDSIRPIYYNLFALINSKSSKFKPDGYTPLYTTWQYIINYNKKYYSQYNHAYIILSDSMATDEFLHDTFMKLNPDITYHIIYYANKKYTNYSLYKQQLAKYGDNFSLAHNYNELIEILKTSIRNFLIKLYTNIQIQSTSQS